MRTCQHPKKIHHRENESKTTAEPTNTFTRLMRGSATRIDLAYCDINKVDLCDYFWTMFQKNWAKGESGDCWGVHAMGE